jgi:hypothetical protein
MFSIVIYTHSDYFDILPIQLEYFDKLVNKLSDKTVYLLSNEPFPECKYKTLLYDQTTPYATRLRTGLEEINDEYIVFTHENDVLVRFNESFIEDIIQAMAKHGIDSVELKHDTRGSDPIPINTETSMVKKTEYFYNVQPTLWKREQLLQVLRQFPEKAYRTIEHDDLQSYMRENYKTYTLLCSEKIKSIWYELPAGYCYLHMTSRLMLLPCIKKNNLHPEIQAEHEQIFLRHLQYSTRSIQDHLYAYDNSLVESTKE